MLYRYSNLALTRVYLPRALQYTVKIKDNAVIHKGPRCGASKRMVNKLHSNVTLGIGQNNCSYWGQLPIGHLKKHLISSGKSPTKSGPRGP